MKGATELTDDWPAPPLIAGDWKTLSLGDACALLARLSATQVAEGGEASAWSVEFSRVRAMPLHFARRWLLAEADARFSDGERGLLTLLYGPQQRLIPAKWVPGVLRTLGWQHNDWPEDATAQAEQYVRLFVAYTMGSEGRFALMDSLDTLVASLAEGAILTSEVRNKIVPMRVTADENGYKAEATVAYAGALFLATFKLDHAGTVEMIDDTPLGTIAMRAEELRGPFRVFLRKGAVTKADMGTPAKSAEGAHESSHE